MGKDLGDGKLRYLLLPIKEFYEHTEDPIYKTYYEILKQGVSAPYLSADDRKTMQNVLRPLIFE